MYFIKNMKKIAIQWLIQSIIHYSKDVKIHLKKKKDKQARLVIGKYPIILKESVIQKVDQLWSLEKVEFQ